MSAYDPKRTSIVTRVLAAYPTGSSMTPCLLNVRTRDGPLMAGADQGRGVKDWLSRAVVYGTAHQTRLAIHLVAALAMPAQLTWSLSFKHRI